MASTTKYVRLTIDKEAASSPASSSSSLSSPSISAPSPSCFSCTRISPRFPCAVIVVAILTLAIFGFRCLTYVTPSPCTYDYSTLPVGAGNSNDTSGPPPTPKLTRRLPDAIIFGVRKCGTRALLNFLNRHPSVRAAGKEIHYFDNNYYLGDDWYREQMPLAADDQIVVEKTPGYFIEPNAPMRVMNTLGTNVKLILIVRDPVERTVSDYVQLKLKYERTKNRRRDADLDARPPLPMASFEEKVLSSDGRINTSYKPVRIGQYDVHLKRWMDVFPARQILVVDGENFVKNPFQSLVRSVRYAPSFLHHAMAAS